MQLTLIDGPLSMLRNTLRRNPLFSGYRNWNRKEWKTPINLKKCGRNVPAILEVAELDLPLYFHLFIPF